MKRKKNRFTSVLQNEIKDFIELKKSQGHTEKGIEQILHTLDEYLANHKHSDKSLPPSVVEGWISSFPPNRNINTNIVYISHYRTFANYLSSLGYEAFLPERPIAKKDYIPFIFSENELDNLIKAADLYVNRVNSCGRHTAICFAFIIRILIGCGLRLDEVLSLKTQNVELDTGIIHIFNAKGNKDRIVPMNETLLESLKLYANSNLPIKEGLFFPSKHGKKISQAVSRKLFNRYLSILGIDKPKLEPFQRNICIHCLRHSFAVHSFRKQHLLGKDLYSEVPILSVYMGHENLYGTEHYLHLTAENINDISNLLDKFYSEQQVFPEVTS